MSHLLIAARLLCNSTGVVRSVIAKSDSNQAGAIRMAAIASVPHLGVTFGIVPGFAFDLSPDGHVLAVLSEGVLTIMRVP